MTNTIEITPESIMADAAKAQASGDAKALASLWAKADGLESLADSKALASRIGAWRAGGAIMAACVGLAKPGQDLHTVAQQDIADAAKAIAGIDVKRDRAKKLLRANLYVTPALLVDASDSIGKANGPASAQALDVVRWCQAHDAKGRASLGKANGQDISALPKAQAVKALGQAATVTAKAQATAQAKAERDTATAKGLAIIAQADDTVYGQMTAARWAAMSAETLADVIATAQAVKLGRAAKAKAERAAKPKATAKPKADAAKVPGDEAFQAAVAQAVAQALASLQA